MTNSISGKRRPATSTDMPFVTARWRPQQIEFPADLPVVAMRDDIVAAIRRHPVVIVCGATGSGKTTQLPKLCLEAGRGEQGRIACTQPRRIAARALADRIAQELHTAVGEGVGYKVRFHDRVREDTAIKIMTDGMLLAEIVGNRLLREYDTIILDEAHERSLNIDFLLGYLRGLLPRRPDLRVIIASATLDAARFSAHFHNAPVIEVSGRSYPVELRYRPLEAASNNPATEQKSRPQPDEDRLTQAILSAVDELAHLGDGGILIFLPGEREIRDVAEALRKHHPAHTEILPLFSRLSVQEQTRIFQPGNARRIVLATNVAETSLTVPGIRYVVDSGLARVPRYSLRNKVDQLLTEPISQAAANQRAGRCGRVAAGVCIRLYSELDFAARPPYTDAEILRTSLAGTILRMQALKLGQPEAFPFLDAPSPRAIAEGFAVLEELGAVDQTRRMTDTGRQLARLPLEPRVGRVLLAAQQFGCLREALVICAALSVQDVRDRPAAQAGSADDRHRAFADERSDFMGLLKLWAFYDDALRHQKSRRQLQQLCQEHFLNAARLREWREVHGQLSSSVAELGVRENEIPASYEAIHCALLAGFPGQIGVKQDEGGYQGTRGIRFWLHPSSILAKKSPKWVMVGELTETSRLYGRLAAKIEPEWLERVATHLCQSQYFDPHWDRRSAQVNAFEQVQLFGLIIVPRRRVHYGSIDPVISREIFIRQALVAGEFDTKAAFFAHNQRVLQEAADLEHKARRLDVLVDDEGLFAFFDARVPAHIVNGAGFEHWRREAEQQTPRLLCFEATDVMRHDAASVTEEWYPKVLQVDGLNLPLHYRFEPNHLLDGVTLNVPLPLLNTLTAWRMDWLVPGMLREKLNWYVRNLPKSLRQAFVPVADTVTAAMQALRPTGPLPELLAGFLSARTGLNIVASVWGEPPPHLKMNIRLLADDGEELGMARDIQTLRAQWGSSAQLAFSEADSDIERSGMTQWEVGELACELSVRRAGVAVAAYPALVDEGEDVSLCLFDTAEAAQAAHHAGVLRLARIALRAQLSQLEKDWPDATRLALAYRPLGNPDALRSDWLQAILEQACLADLPDNELPRSQKSFEQLIVKARVRLRPVADALNRVLAEVLAQYAILAPQVARISGISGKDMQEQLRQLVYSGFVRQTPWPHMQQLLRYLQGLQWRVEKYGERREQDARHTAAIARLREPWQVKMQSRELNGEQRRQLLAFRWQLEELRISLFAQQLKTPYPVSVKRLEKHWQEISGC